MIMISRRVFFLLIAIFPLALGGCFGATMLPQMLTEDDPVNLKQSHTAAVDFLIEQSRHHIARGSQIIVMPLTASASRPEAVGGVSDFGRVFADHAVERLRQLGYQADLSGQGGQDDALFRFGGTYEPEKDLLRVRLYTVNAKEGREITSFAYYLPLNRDIKLSLGWQGRVEKERPLSPYGGFLKE